MTSKTEWRKGRLVVLLLVLALVLWYFLLREKPPADPDKIWPEQGEVIAVIEGKEYRYDPNYLYRLTNYCFSEDPNKPISDIFAYASGGYAENFLFGDNQGEAAICLELVYKEWPEYLKEPLPKSVIDVYVDNRYWDFHSLQSARKKPHRAEIFARYREAKFFPLQFYDLYARDLYPYTKKFAYIDTVLMDWDSPLPKWDEKMSGLEQEEFYGLRESEEGQNTIDALIGENLLKKYNVEMVE